jgi:EF-P beta-lysylation protein EpmB
MKTAVRDPVELCRLVGLPERFEEPARRAARLFAVFAPRAYLAKVRRGDPGDPLLRQVLPLDEELSPREGFTPDPVGDLAALREPGLLQKYSGRALLVTTGVCAVHCRYCFRRHFAYDEAPRGLSAWEPALARMERDESLREVLLSGGDPLTLADEHLAALARRIAQIPHVRRLRIHSRLPIVIPERVTDALLTWLRGTRLVPMVVVHANHPRELDRAVAAALGRLVDSGVPVLNQSVLLRGVNDSAEVLAELCERLVDLRVAPYYLHQLDRVSGAAHFEVAPAVGVRIVEQLRARLPGYAVPRYVREVPGAAGKVVLS